MRRLIINSGVGYPGERFHELYAIKEAGWDGVFTGWNEQDNNEAVTKVIADLGLYYHSVHAPFDFVDTLWEDGIEGDRQVERQIRCLTATKESGVNRMILHAMFDVSMAKASPTALGVKRFGKIFDAAARLGVTVALENAEDEIYLKTLLDTFADAPHVGFCIDTGHEMCYNFSSDMIGKYGHKLVSTHLNDNCGMTGDTLTWHDDYHLMPFDGKADWEGIANRLNKAGYKGDLTFELSCQSKPNRHANDGYQLLTPLQFMTEAIDRAKRLRDLIG